MICNTGRLQAYGDGCISEVGENTAAATEKYDSGQLVWADAISAVMTWLQYWARFYTDKLRCAGHNACKFKICILQ